MPQITTKEASQILGISKRTLFRWEKEGKIKSMREGILKVRVYDQDYVALTRELLDLNKQIDKHNARLPEIKEQSLKHQLEQTYIPGKPLRLPTSLDAEAAMKASADEEEWLTEYYRLNNDFALLIRIFRTKFPKAPLERLLLKEDK